MSFKLGAFAPPELADNINGLPLEPAVKAIQGIAANGHRQVLVVGGTSTIPPELREHAQVVWWDLKDKDTLPPAIPKLVSLVVITRFIRHLAMHGLKDQCKQRGITMVTHPLGTGQVKKLLQPLVHTATAQPVTQTREERDMSDAIDKAVAQVRTFGRGELAAFVAQHADLTKVPYVLEARRLFMLAEAQGISTTEGSIAQAMVQARRVQQEPAAPQEPVVAEPVARPAPPPAAAQARASAMQDDDVELVRMLDDVLAGVALVRQTFINRAEKRAQLRELLKDI